MTPAIYTIAKNEAHNVAAFMAAAEGAPVYVLDTGSTDATVELLKRHGAIVEQQIVTPWRFDTARNISLSMVPTSVDVCVSLDMDEVIEAGWQNKLKDQWKGNIGNYKYIAEWKDKAKTIPSVIGPRTRLHSRLGFEWHRKIHEVIKPLPETNLVLFDTDIVVKHYQDNKQRNYSSSLDDLLKENPYDMDSRLQRAGEMYQKQEWAKAIEDYKFYVHTLADNQDPVTRYRKALAWVALAYCYYKQGDTDSELPYRCFLHSVAEYPEYREGWCHIANIASQLNNAPLAYGASMTAWNIKKAASYAVVDTAFWGDLPKQIADSMFSRILKER